jgi:hypothetical protein
VESARRNLLVVACLLASSSASADTLVASMGYDHTWFVHRVAGTKVQKLDGGKDAVAMAFSDAHTLWVLRSVKGKLAIVRIADAKAQSERKLDLDGLQNAYAPVTWPGSLIAAEDGSVWLLGCNPNDKAAGTPSCKRLYLRVDNDSFTVAKTHPKAMSSYAPVPTPIAEPACKNRKGPRLGPDAKDFTALSANPPVMRATVSIGCDEVEIVLNGECPPGPAYILDCKTFVDDVRALPDGVLAISKDSKSWQLYTRGKVFATLPGGAELMVAP